MGKDNVTYKVIEGIPEASKLKNIHELYFKIFDDADLTFFNHRLQEKSDFVFVLAYLNLELIAFKIGYRYNQNTLYSWVGGVNKEFRRQGIGNTLARLQAEHATKLGYTSLRTKSMNKFKPMMILNLKNGFDIKSIYTNKIGQTKIVFERRLI